MIRDAELYSHFAALHITEANRHLPADHRLKPINYSARPAALLRFHIAKGNTSPLNERHRWRKRQRNCEDKKVVDFFYTIFAVLPKCGKSSSFFYLQEPFDQVSVIWDRIYSIFRCKHWEQICGRPSVQHQLPIITIPMRSGMTEADWCQTNTINMDRYHNVSPQPDG